MRSEDLDRLIGAVVWPEVRVPGTYATPGGPHPGVALADDYLRRFPPPGIVVFGRTPAGPISPVERLLDVERRAEALGIEPPLVACDLEQGAGLHFPEGTRMPPAMALAAAAKGHGDTGHGLNWVRSAAYVTALEARSLGVDLVLAPVADLNTRDASPIVAVRGFGDVPEEAALRASAYCEGLQAGGAGACAKHFPGHGDTDLDSHRELPRLDADVATLRARELVPFRALIEAGVDAVMVGHLAVPALERLVGGEPGLPASLSRSVVTGLLRGELGFGGPVLSDAMNMGALESFGEARYAQALSAGCDGLLCPADPLEAVAALRRAVRLGDLDPTRLTEAAERGFELRARLVQRRAAPRGTRLHPDVRGASLGGHAAFAGTVAERALCCSGTAADWAGLERFDVRPAFPEDAEPGGLLAALGGLWREGVASEGAATGMALAVGIEVRAGSGACGLGAERRAALERRLAGLAAEGVPAVVLWFASPQALPAGWWDGLATGPDLGSEAAGARVVPAPPVLVAFAPTEPMARAVGRVLEGRAAATGSLPVRPG